MVIDHVFEDTEMDDIIVQGWGKSGKPLEEEIVSVDVVNTQLIESNAIINASDAIERVPIVIVDGQIRSRWRLCLRTGSRNLVIDDVPILTPERNEILWDLYPWRPQIKLKLLKAHLPSNMAHQFNELCMLERAGPNETAAQTRIRTFSTFYDKALRIIVRPNGGKHQIQATAFKAFLIPSDSPTTMASTMRNETRCSLWCFRHNGPNPYCRRI